MRSVVRFDLASRGGSRGGGAGGRSPTGRPHRKARKFASTRGRRSGACGPETPPCDTPAPNTRRLGTAWSGSRGRFEAAGWLPTRHEGKVARVAPGQAPSLSHTPPARHARRSRPPERTTPLPSRQRLHPEWQFRSQVRSPIASILRHRYSLAVAHGMLPRAFELTNRSAPPHAPPAAATLAGCRAPLLRHNPKAV